MPLPSTQAEIDHPQPPRSRVVTPPHTQHHNARSAARARRHVRTGRAATTTCSRRSARRVMSASSRPCRRGRAVAAVLSRPSPSPRLSLCSFYSFPPGRRTPHREPARTTVRFATAFLVRLVGGRPRTGRDSRIVGRRDPSARRRRDSNVRAADDDEDGYDDDSNDKRRASRLESGGYAHSSSSSSQQ